eukprot:5494337-Amphidinium_carterae.1
MSTSKSDAALWQIDWALSGPGIGRKPGGAFMQTHPASGRELHVKLRPVAQPAPYLWAPKSKGLGAR